MVEMKDKFRFGGTSAEHKESIKIIPDYQSETMALIYDNGREIKQYFISFNQAIESGIINVNCDLVHKIFNS